MGVSTTKFTGHNGHVANCMPTGSSSRAVSLSRYRIRTLSWMRILCSSPWVSPARSETDSSTGLGVNYDARLRDRQ